MTADPYAFGRAAAHATLAQDARPRLSALPGGRRPDALVPGRSHVTVRPKPEPATPTILLAVSLLEASLMRSVLVATGSRAGAELARKIGSQCHPSCIVEVDPANPHGIERPVS